MFIHFGVWLLVAHCLYRAASVEITKCTNIGTGCIAFAKVNIYGSHVSVHETNLMNGIKGFTNGLGVLTNFSLSQTRYPGAFHSLYEVSIVHVGPDEEDEIFIDYMLENLEDAGMAET